MASWWVLAHTVECISEHIIWIVNHFDFLPWPTNILGNHFLVHKTFKIEIQKGGPNNSDFLQNWFPQEIRSPLFDLQKFQHYAKSTSESCRMHWNLMNDKEFGSGKLLKLKYRRWDQIFQILWKIGSCQKLALPCLVCRNFKTLPKVLLNHAEYIEMQWMIKNLGLENF